ncbi:MAG: Glucan 1,3-beta-glucosidase 3 [Phylliscum demangeonii]|nr:MAG: Glucan 1,3-beta-glucosidase 3 [Phylliscum demangeonii]
MKRLMQKARAGFFPSADASQPLAQTGGQQLVLKQTEQPAPATTSTVAPPTATDILRYRYHHGTNLGSVFVLERWLSPSMFVDGAAGGSELDAVRASLAKSGLDATRQKWESHWRGAVSDSDWDWLVHSGHCTTIRLPIGYFTLGARFCAGTPFDGQPAQVYANAWSAVRDFVARARAHGIGVLLDFHALPGGANAEDHSGTSSHQAALWGNAGFLALAQNAVVFMAQEARSLDGGVVGLQLCNEAVANAPGMYAWYDAVLNAVAAVDASLPIYLSDGWDLASAVRYSNRHNTVDRRGTNPVVIDTHKYYTFAASDKQQAPAQIIARVASELAELDGHERDVAGHGAAQAFVGEYSCVLDPQTWAKVDASQRSALILQFGQAQSRTWQARAGGSAFWTYKMDWMDGGEWGFVAQTKSGAIVPPPSLTLAAAAIQSRVAAAQQGREASKTAALAAHVAYWTRTAPAPAQPFEHWRYPLGWDVGFSDALAFAAGVGAGAGAGAGPGVHRIGLLDLWVCKRLRESDQRGPFVWEWEQGMRQGVAAAEQALGL